MFKPFAVIHSNPSGSSKRARFVGRASNTLLVLVSALLPCVAQAGPVEQFADMALHPTDAKKIVIGYENGLAGIFVSQDGGKSFRLRNSQSIKLMDDTYFPREDIGLLQTTDALLVGGSAGLITGTFETCGLAQGTTLLADWASALAPHPEDPAVAFVVTNKDKAPRGGLFRRAAGGELSPLGADHGADLSVTGLRVVTRMASSERLRFVEMGSRKNGAAARVPVVRYSDDLGASWSERALPATSSPTVRLLAVDPLNPDVFLLAVQNTGEPDPPDDLLLSTNAGMTFAPYASLSGLTDPRYTTFAPDGRFWLGDRGAGGGLWYAARLGEAASKVGDFPVHCLAHDKSQDALLVCKAYELGRFTPADKSFCQMFRIYEASGFPDCAGENLLSEPDTKDQMCVNYCNATHYWYSRLCAQYNDVQAACGLGTLQTAFAEQLPGADSTPRCDGFPSNYEPPGSAGGAEEPAPDAGGDAGRPDASAVAPASDGGVPGSDGGLGAAPTEDGPHSKKKGGCSVSASSNEEARWQMAALFVGLVGLLRRRRGARARAGVPAAWLVVIACACISTQAACGDDDAGAATDGAAGDGEMHMHPDAGAEAGGDHEYPQVACDPGLAKHPTDVQGDGEKGILKVTVAEADHDPARKYTNTWVIVLSDADGQPVTDAEFSNARTWMPVHGHDGKFPPETMPDAAGEGRYTFDGLNFTMTGPWQVQFDVSSASAGADSFVLDVCVGE